MVSTLHLAQDDIDHLLPAAVAYAMGRGTYADDSVFDTARDNWHVMSSTVQAELADRITHDKEAPVEWKRIAMQALANPQYHDSRTLRFQPLDCGIMLFSAFRHDMQSDEPDIPKRWERYAQELSCLYANHWNLNTARDLLRENLIPLDEPLGDVRPVSNRVEPADGRWVGFFRLMRDGAIGPESR